MCGAMTLEQLNEYIQTSCTDHEISFFQSNIEGELIDRIQKISAMVLKGS